MPNPNCLNYGKKCDEICATCQSIQTKRAAAKPAKTTAKPRKPAAKKQVVAAPDYMGCPDKFIGVDPALRANGFWVCVIDRILNTATFHPCKHLGEFVKLLNREMPIAVTVENSNMQKAVFDKKSGVGGAISVGKNQGVSQAATDIAQEYSVIPAGISPKAKGAKIVNEAVFQGVVRSNLLTLVGYKPGESPGQDQRDALKLALICEQGYKLHLKSLKK